MIYEVKINKLLRELREMRKTAQAKEYVEVMKEISFCDLIYHLHDDMLIIRFPNLVECGGQSEGILLRNIKKEYDDNGLHKGCPDYITLRDIENIELYKNEKGYTRGKYVRKIKKPNID